MWVRLDITVMVDWALKINYLSIYSGVKISQRKSLFCFRTFLCLTRVISLAGRQQIANKMAAFLNKPSDFTAKSAGGKLCREMLCLTLLVKNRIWYVGVRYFWRFWINGVPFNKNVYGMCLSELALLACCRRHFDDYNVFLFCSGSFTNFNFPECATSLF